MYNFVNLESILFSLSSVRVFLSGFVNRSPDAHYLIMIHFYVLQLLCGDFCSYFMLQAFFGYRHHVSLLRQCESVILFQVNLQFNYRQIVDLLLFLRFGDK